MNKLTDDSFEKKKQKIISKFLSDFLPAYEEHALKQDFANDKLVDVDNMISNHYDSDIKLNADFHRVLKLKNKKIGRTYTEAILIYCTEIQEHPRKLFEYTLKLKALDELKTLLIKDYGGNLNRYLADTNSKGLTYKNKNGTYPIARKIIILSKLLQAAAGNNDVLSQKDKTDVARFIDVLISEKPSAGDIRDNHIYKKTKSLYGNLESASIEDLKFAAQEFEKIGLSSIVNDIHSAIETKLKPKKR